MGSGSSLPEPKQQSSGTTTTTPSQKSITASKDEKSSELTGVPLIEYKCRRKERIWKKCVHEFYSEKFLPGQALEQEEYCGDKFEAYRKCYLKGMQKVFWEGKEKGKPAEFSFMGDFFDEEEEN